MHVRPGPRHRGRAALAALVTTVVATGVTLTGCSLTGGEPAAAPGGEASGGGSGGSKELTVVTHDSFALSKPLLADFSRRTGYTVRFVAPGDAGALVNQLVLTKDSPLGDVVYGVDNSFAGRAVSAGVVEPYRSASLPEAAQADVPDDRGSLTPVDRGDVCVNVDHDWYRKKKLAEPATLEDLTKPEYRDQLVVENAASSSPGLSFVLASVGEYGASGWQDYWKRLQANGVKVVDGWTAAYTVDFSGSEGKGSRPLVVSYSSSPAAEVDDGRARTGALLDTCFRQVEYAGVLTGAKNPDGARAFIDFLLSRPVQADIPGQMYMYPIDPAAPLPADWKKHAPLASEPKQVQSAWLADNRDQLIKDWSALVGG